MSAKNASRGSIASFGAGSSGFGCMAALLLRCARRRSSLAGCDAPVFAEAPLWLSPCIHRATSNVSKPTQPLPTGASGSGFAAGVTLALTKKHSNIAFASLWRHQRPGPRVALPDFSAICLSPRNAVRAREDFKASTHQVSNDRRQGVAELAEVLAGRANAEHEEHKQVGRHLPNDPVVSLQHLCGFEACKRNDQPSAFYSTREHMACLPEYVSLPGYASIS